MLTNHFTVYYYYNYYYYNSFILIFNNYIILLLFLLLLLLLLLLGLFYSGDSYIVLYSFNKNGKDYNIIYFWLGNDSNNDEKGAAG